MRNPTPNRRLRSTGFTLIELLVVIVIIAILAAILFPVFSRARDRGRVAACQSNMKQIGLAVQQYLDDWDSHYPDQASVNYPPANRMDEAANYMRYMGKDNYSNAAGGAWIQWFSHRYRFNDAGAWQPAGFARHVAPYIRNLDVFKCSSEWKDRPGGYLDHGSGSSYYVKLAMQFYASENERPLRMPEIPFPTKTTLLYEEVWHNDGYDRPFLWDPGFWAGRPNRPPFRRVHAIFMDGHVGNIDVPWHNTSGFDPNWYFYKGQTTDKRPGHHANIARGDRDRW